jgi:Arc/MetJ family transcription regulator
MATTHTSTIKRGRPRSGGFARTNVELDEELIEQARQLTGLQTKKDIVNEALALLVRLKRQEGIKKLRGKLHWEGDLDQVRRGRFQDVDC